MTNSYAQAAPVAKKPRNTLLLLGLVVLLAGVLTAAGLWFASGKRFDDAVSGLARAPVGCDTTLDFDAAGEFLIFLESEGTIDEVAGDCGVEGDFATDGSNLPSVRVTLVGPDGDEVDLDRRSGITYDTQGSVGQSIRVVEITDPGLHTLTVVSPSDDVALAVGRDPNNGVGTLKNFAAIAAIAGLIGGGILLIASTRRKPAPTPAPAPWQPAGPAGWATGPPGMPPAQHSPTWEPAVGPPTQYPQQPTAAPAAWNPVDQPAAPSAPDSVPVPTWQPAPTPPPPPSVPGSWAPQPPAAPQPSFESGEWPTRAERPDGSSGDGERSPWAPPTDDAH